MFQKSFPAISHDYFSIQIKGQYISHNYCSIQKYAYTISHNPFSDQKKDHSILHNPKLILGIVLFYRQGRGVLHTPHMYIDF